MVISRTCKAPRGVPSHLKALLLLTFVRLTRLGVRPAAVPNPTTLDGRQPPNYRCVALGVVYFF